MTVVEVSVLIVMSVGLIGLIIPIFPGLAVIWLAGLTYGLLEGFGVPGLIAFSLMTLLAVAGSLIDNVLMAASSRRGGAAWSSVLLAGIAGLLGTIFFPPFGGLIATPVVVLLLEYRRRRDWARSWQAVKGLLIGWGASFFARLGIGLGMMLSWAVWVWLV